ncbi:hypothetical protein DAI22_04g033400 [Oryza sativa Japonica Group]|nr:hypothetical protein DAI22_04g033400 [Oryza sativa Japonica Group]
MPPAPMCITRGNSLLATPWRHRLCCVPFYRRGKRQHPVRLTHPSLTPRPLAEVSSVLLFATTSILIPQSVQELLLQLTNVTKYIDFS